MGTIRSPRVAVRVHPLEFGDRERVGGAQLHHLARVEDVGGERVAVEREDATAVEALVGDHRLHGATVLDDRREADVLGVHLPADEVERLDGRLVVDDGRHRRRDGCHAVIGRFGLETAGVARWW
jgi:hypothetical protein